MPSPIVVTFLLVNVAVTCSASGRHYYNGPRGWEDVDSSTVIKYVYDPQHTSEAPTYQESGSTFHFKYLLPKSSRQFLSRLTKPDSREENGGLGIVGRRIFKLITAPFVKLANVASNTIFGQNRGGGLDMDRNFMNGHTGSFQDRVRLLFPGTVWCGDGNKAKSDNDIGVFRLTDNCCRNHDKCSKFIYAGEDSFGLKNSGLFARLHCDCDAEFHWCLKNANTIIARKIGFTYFSVLGPQCFKKDYPIISCKRRHMKRCVEYYTDHTKNKTYQWFDNDVFNLV